MVVGYFGGVLSQDKIAMENGNRVMNDGCGYKDGIQKENKVIETNVDKLMPSTDIFYESKF